MQDPATETCIAAKVWNHSSSLKKTYQIPQTFELRWPAKNMSGCAGSGIRMATSFPRTEDCMLILISSHIYLEFLESTSTLLQHADGHQTTPELNYKDLQRKMVLSAPRASPWWFGCWVTPWPPPEWCADPDGTPPATEQRLCSGGVQSKVLHHPWRVVATDR